MTCANLRIWAESYKRGRWTRDGEPVVRLGFHGVLVARVEAYRAVGRCLHRLRCGRPIGGSRRLVLQPALRCGHGGGSQPRGSGVRPRPGREAVGMGGASAGVLPGYPAYLYAATQEPSGLKGLSPVHAGGIDVFFHAPAGGLLRSARSGCGQAPAEGRGVLRRLVDRALNPR